MGLIFIRDDQLHIKTVNKKRFKPDDGWQKLFKMMNTKKGSKGMSGYRQCAYFHVRYSKVNSKYGKKLARAHLEYIVRDGVGKDGKKPGLYGNITREELLAIRANEENHFRFILSPERLGNIDLQAFVESYMRYISHRTGYQLLWVASDHYNTAYPHTHIIVKGVDRAGKVVRFSHYQVRSVFRDIARDYLTYLLGERVPGQEKKLARALQTHYSYLDKKIENLISNNILLLKNIDKAFRSQELDLIKARLEFLATIKLIFRTKDGYQFEKGWIDTLKQIGRSDSFMAAVKSISYNHPSQTIKFESGKHKRICGIISHTGRKDELSDYNFMIIEALDGKNYICNLSPLSKLMVNDVVVLDGKHFRSVKTIGEIGYWLTGKPDSPIKQCITNTLLSLQKDRHR